MDHRVLRPRTSIINYHMESLDVPESISTSLKSASQAPTPPITKNHSASKRLLPTGSKSIETEAIDSCKPGNDSTYKDVSSVATPAVRKKNWRCTSSSELKKPPIQGKPDISSLPPPPHFDYLKHPKPEHKGYNNLPKELRRVDLKPYQIFDLFFTPNVIKIMVENTNLYAQKRMAEGDGYEGRNARWTPVTESELYIWLGLTIHMGCLGLPPSHYWKRDGRLLPREGLPTTIYMSQMKFEQIRRYFHVSPPDLDDSKALWHHKIDPLLDQLRLSSQKYRVPSSNVTIDEAMILFTGRSIHITKMPNKPIGVGYKFFALADKGYIWDFHPSSNAHSLDPVDLVSEKLGEGFSKTSKMVHHLVRRLHLRHRKKTFNIFMDNYFTSVPLLSELRKMGVGACGTAKVNLKGFPKELDVGKKAKLAYHAKYGVVKDGVGVLLWMDSGPVIVMTTIHPLAGEDSEAMKHRLHPGNKSSNALGAETVFQGQREKDMLIPIAILAYNLYKVGVDVADQYRTYYDTQLTSLRNWYPIFYWILETSLINSFIIYRDIHTGIDHLDYRLDVAWSFIERGVGTRKLYGEVSPSLGTSRRRWNEDLEITSPPSKRVTRKSKLPESRTAPGNHFPVHFDGRLDCFLCRWRKVQEGSTEDPKKTSVKCFCCNEALCFTKERNCFLQYHV